MNWLIRRIEMIEEMKLQMGQARRKALGASIRAGRQAGVNFSILRFA